MGFTLVEKVAARHADGLAEGTVVRAGDFVSIRPRHVMTHDNTGAVIPKFKQIGATAIADPAQPVFAIDHDIQNVTPKNLEKYARIEAFASEHGIDFYPAGTGISHQVMVEQGYVVPGALVVASDSHSNLYGAMAALGTPVVRTDAASIWATGVTWRRALAGSRTRNGQENAARRVAPAIPRSTSTPGGKIEVSSALIPTQTMRSSSSLISRRSCRTCPVLTK